MDFSSTTAIGQHPSQASAYSRTTNAIDIIATGGLGHVPAFEEDSISSHSSENGIEDAIHRYESQFLPYARRSLSGIALRAFLLGLTFTSSTILTFYILLTTNSPAWRAPSFVSIVSLFHFLEFWTTAAYNTHEASVSSFLLSANGAPYIIAMISAFLESLVTTILYPNHQILPPSASHALTILGLLLVIVCQYIRTLAIITAGQSFNHIVQHTRKKTHTLIDFGIYAYLRHPSYFGYFWWGLGTQLLLGNSVCFVLYALALWRFFARRIPGEEKGLVKFFGDDYVRYREKTPIGIPFVY